MLRLNNISKKFNGIDVLKNLCCEVDQEDFVVIMGPNGAGKTTLFDIVSGKTDPDQGTLFIEGQDCTLMPEQKRATAVGRLFQNTYLGSCSSLTIRENLAIANLKGQKAGLRRGTKSLPDERIEELLMPLNLNLEKMLHVPMGALSGGQRQIVSFVMATLKQPKLLLLDEPTAALDPGSATQLLSFAQEYARRNRIPTLLITHDPMTAKYLGNRLWILNQGRIEREYGMEKRDMDPQDFFRRVNYESLASGFPQSHDDRKGLFLCCK